MNKYQKSLIDEANDLIREADRRIKIRRREDLMETWASRVYWMVLGGGIMFLYIGFRWNLFQYIFNQWWQHFTQWALSWI